VKTMSRKVMVNGWSAASLSHPCAAGGVGIHRIRRLVLAPKANAVVERMIRTIRRECLDCLIVLNQACSQSPPCEPEGFPIARGRI